MDVGEIYVLSFVAVEVVVASVVVVVFVFVVERDLIRMGHPTNIFLFLFYAAL